MKESRRVHHLIAGDLLLMAALLLVCVLLVFCACRARRVRQEKIDRLLEGKDS